MKFPKGTYSAFPTALKGRHPYEQVLLAWLIFHADEGGGCYPSIQLLIEETGMSKSTILRTAEKLEQDGTLSISRMHRKSNFYQIHMDHLGVTQTPKNKVRVSHRHPQGITQTPKLGVTQTPQLINSLEPMNRTKDNNIGKSQKKEIVMESVGELEDLFLEFKENRKQMKKPMTEIAERNMRKKFNKFVALYGLEATKARIEYSINKPYDDIYPPKEIAPPKPKMKFDHE